MRLDVESNNSSVESNNTNKKIKITNREMEEVFKMIDKERANRE